MIEIGMLGPLEVRFGGEVLTPTAAKIRQVLALMLFRHNQVVSLDAITEELWAERPPRTAVTTAQTYIYQLRKLFAAAGGDGRENQVLRTVAPGYLISLPATARIDIWTFEQRIAQGQSLLLDGRNDEARTLLERSLGMWRGAVLYGTGQGRYLQAYAANLDEKRLLAQELRLWADMLVGRYRPLIPELRSLVLAHPFNEWLHAQLMIALYQSGRRSEALDAYQNARRLLDQELGLEPSEYLQRVHQRVLSASAFRRSAHGTSALAGVDDYEVVRPDFEAWLRAR